MRRRRRASCARGFLLLLLLWVPACGGGGGGGGPTQPRPQPGITFTPSGGSAASSLSLRRSAASSGSRLVLELYASEVTDLFGIAFDLSYPPNLLRFEGLDEDSFLSESGNVSTSLQVAEAPLGNLIVGLTRLASASGRSGSGVVLVLEFQGIGNGSGSLSFDRNQALDPRGAVQNVAWFGGSVQVAL